MKYMSSRGAEKGLSFQKVLFSGYAKDGGLYFPESVPALPPGLISSWSTLSYPDLVKQIMKLFIHQDEIPSLELDKLIENAFISFRDPTTPIQIARLKNNIAVAELFHGPTLAFKDLALCVVGQLYEYFLARAQKHMTVLIGTSGDTGSAAISAVRGLEWVDVVVLLPKGRCTMIQELQMTTVLEDNVHNFCVDGTSDDLDVPIKAVFADADYVEKHNLCSINSINWARILVQISHYFYCYYQMVEKPGDRVEIIIPTGACGNIAAGYVAREMGLPVDLVAAVTPNDIVHRTLQTGDFSLSEEVLQSWATAMDIQVPYNVERMILMASGLDTSRVCELMKIFEESHQGCQIPEDLLNKIRDVVVDSMMVDNDVMIDVLGRCFTENDYIICPHTSVGVAYAYANPKPIPQVRKP
ncbi:threonine synthase-like 2 [Eurytemora carolleeae]|uniref:threonine synthase-like 2 n=1 Tax=Eurytemora carolleeae TaxID=1294199 RepID=UPI000C77C180|nr:threonine synthase-like 2 [Eurytemora carolleeae]|eukprot:XP_023343189.1 threonine synthase-like 2 [Eurytemora affinis]